MNSPTTNPQDEFQIAPVYMVFTGELVLDAPAHTAWPHVINYPAWQNYAIVQHIAGERGQEGEVMLLKKDEKGVTTPPYFARTIKLDPGRRIIWKVYPEQRTPQNDFFGFVDFQLAEVNGKTHFHHNSIHEFQLRYRHASELDEFRQRRRETTDTLFATIFAKLRKLVEERA